MHVGRIDNGAAESGGAFKTLAVNAENPVSERRDSGKRFIRPVAMRSVANVLEHRSLDRAVAFLLDHAHLRERTVWIGRTLHY